MTDGDGGTKILYNTLDVHKFIFEDSIGTSLIHLEARLRIFKIYQFVTNLHYHCIKCNSQAKFLLYGCFLNCDAGGGAGGKRFIGTCQKPNLDICISSFLQMKESRVRKGLKMIPNTLPQFSYPNPQTEENYYINSSSIFQSAIKIEIFFYLPAFDNSSLQTRWKNGNPNYSV